MPLSSPSSRASWVGCALVVALALVYACVYSGRRLWATTATRESYATGTDGCLTTRTLTKYENATRALTQTLQDIVGVFDAETPEGATGGENDGAGTDDASAQALATVDGGNTTPATRPEKDALSGLPGSSGSGGMRATVEGFGTADGSGCVRDAQRAQRAFTEGPKALLGAYNELRTRVNRGVEGIYKVRNMRADAAKQEKEREKQMVAIEASSAQQEKQLDDYYAQGGDA